jgi:hypothetical protein
MAIERDGGQGFGIGPGRKGGLEDAHALRIRDEDGRLGALGED